MESCGLGANRGSSLSQGLFYGPFYKGAALYLGPQEKGALV